jgi:hypothetical protein
MVSASLIHLTPPDRTLSRELLTTPGAFAWWYVDLLDAAGDGAVLIWSFGLPFLPGLRGAAQADRPQSPASWPALNLVAYRSFRPAFYALRRFAPEDCAWIDDDHWRFGRSRIRRTRGERTSIHAELDLALGRGERARGVLSAEGETRRDASATPISPEASEHDWSPLIAGGSGRLSLELEGGRPLHVDGAAYHDRNGGTQPLWDLGIRRWLWGRASASDHTWIWYLLWPEDQPATTEPVAHALRVDGSGECREHSVEDVRVHGDRLRWTGSRVPAQLELTLVGGRRLRATTRALVDDGPFYHREIVELDDGQSTAIGFAEGVVPGRIDLAWQRPLVRMRVTDDTRTDSVFSPLFVGRAESRVKRLLGARAT